jgi:hypothetical protein
LTSAQVSENITTPVISRQQDVHAQGVDATKQLIMSFSGKNAIVHFPAGAEKTIRVLNCQGKTLACAALQDGNKVVIDRAIMGAGILYAAWNIHGRKMLSMVTYVR